VPKTAQAKVRQWPDGAYEAEAEAFRDYWLGEGRAGSRKLDWNRAWCNRINEVTARVLRDAKAGVKFDYAASADRPAKVTPALDNSGECAAARAIRERLSRSITPGSFNAWITPTRFDIAGQTLTVTAPSDMMSGYIQGNFDTDIRRALAAELGKAASLRWRVERPPSRHDDIAPTE
jgi:hypothetical protein